MTRANVPNQSIGYVAAFCAIPIFAVGDQFVSDQHALAVSAAAALSVVIVVSCWALRLERWFWPMMTGTFIVASIVHCWIAEPLSHLSPGYALAVCIAVWLA